MPMMLEVDSVMHEFGTRTILSNVYLKCVPGDIIAILGRNGTGKSTLFKIIFGTLKADNSFIRINDKIYSKEAFHSKQIAYLPQFNFIPKDFSVEKAISLYIDDPSSLRNDPLIKIILNQQIKNLSGGELRYLEIMLILKSKVPFVILDEPFNGLAPIVVEKVRAEIIEVSKNKGIILTDHKYIDVHKVANRLMLLSNSYLKEIKKREELKPFGYYYDV